MVETDSLENCYVRKGIEGSNPSASALVSKHYIRKGFVSLPRRWRGENLTPALVKNNPALLRVYFIPIKQTVDHG